MKQSVNRYAVTLLGKPASIEYNASGRAIIPIFFYDYIKKGYSLLSLLRLTHSFTFKQLVTFEKVKKIWIFFLLNFFLAENLLAQKEDRNWIFGYKCGIKFNDNNAISIYTASNVNHEACASISDSSGNLLFYVDNFMHPGMSTLINVNGTVIENGTDILIEESETQGALILPFPNHPKMYYLFQLYPISSVEYNRPLYSIIDMNANNGNGKVILKNQKLFYDIPDSNFTEKCTAIKHGNQKDWWIIHRTIGTNTFYVTLFDQNGIHPPLMQNIGDPIYNTSWMGQLVFSPTGNYLLSASLYGGLIQLYSFNRCNGLLFDPLTIESNSSSFIGYYGCSFSSDEKLIYVSQDEMLFQYRLDTTNIHDSKKLIADFTLDSSYFGQHLLGPDGKIYISIQKYLPSFPNTNSNIPIHYLSVINNPNLRSTACNFSPFSIYLGENSYPVLGLPNMVNYNLSSAKDLADAGEDEIGCKDGKVQLGIPSVQGAKYEWYFQNWLTATNLDDPHIAQPWATINGSCTYWLRITDTSTFSSCNIRVDTVTVTVAETPCNDGVDFFVPTYLIASDKYFFVHNLPENTSLTIYNMLGQLIYHSSNYQNNFNIQNLPAAAYFYRFNLEAGTEVKGKFEVQR